MAVPHRRNTLRSLPAAHHVLKSRSADGPSRLDPQGYNLANLLLQGLPGNFTEHNSTREHADSSILKSKAIKFTCLNTGQSERIRVKLIIFNILIVCCCT